jgi:hypothetical protein
MQRSGGNNPMATKKGATAPLWFDEIVLGEIESIVLNQSC